mmetsp:Transcript_16499/g.27899  ORF Transcript_16499/g.27899 Transcript_16499/m.27899 type:complete len:556 (-) Transcript_16499:126-1793(-)
MLCCYDDPNQHKIHNFRSKELSVFSLFNIGLLDAAALIELVETLDTKYERHVDVQGFGTMYCGEQAETYTFLFEKFFRLFVPKTAKYEAKDRADAGVGDDKSQSTGINLDSIASETYVSQTKSIERISETGISYHYFLSFLMFFMSIPDVELSLWLFWLYYPARHFAPDHNNLEELIEILWGSAEKHKQIISYLRQKAQNNLIVIEPSEIMAGVFRQFDIRTNNAWTKPLLALRKTIRKTTKLGGRFWRRVGESVHTSCVNIEQCYEHTKHTFRLSKWGKHNYVLVGDRKAARKDIRIFVRLILSYNSMPLDNDDLITEAQERAIEAASQATSVQNPSSIAGVDGGSNINTRGGGRGGADDEEAANEVESSIDKAIRYGAMPFNLISSMVRFVVTARPPAAARILPKQILHQGGKDNNDVEEDDEDIVPLEVKYADSLVAPLDNVHTKISSAQQRAQMMLRQCEDELNYSAFQQDQVESTVDGSSVEGKHPKRDVVVDVSSSSSGSASGDDEGSDGEEDDNEEGEEDYGEEDDDDDEYDEEEEEEPQLKSAMKKK